MAARTLERFGQIDALLANAGIYIPGQMAEGDPDAWAQLIDINVTGVLRCIHAVLPAMMAQKSGDILITSSISGVVDIPWEPVYSASKHAVQGIAHTLRRQVAPSGIRVGAICPGIVLNELWGQADTGLIEQRAGERGALRSADVAQAIVFMLSQPPHVCIRDLVMLPQGQDI